MTSTTSSSISSASKSQSLLPATLPKPNVPSKKTSKDSKNEKSLETTVEKLTQNRNKEISGKNETAGPAKIENMEKEKPKSLESPERHKEVRTGPEKGPQETQKAEPKAEKSETGGKDTASSSLPPPVSSPSSTTVPTPVSTDVSLEKGPSSKGSEAEKSSEVSETAPLESEKVGVSTDAKDGAKKTPCADSCKEAESESNSLRSKDLSNNVDKVKNSEEVVEGSK